MKIKLEISKILETATDAAPCVVVSAVDVSAVVVDVVVRGVTQFWKHSSNLSTAIGGSNVK